MRRRRAAIVYAVADDRPMHGLNTTPLIDVMLVLLVMTIMSIPMMTHQVRIQIPQGPPPASQQPIVHPLRLEASGAIMLDGSPVTLQELPPRLSAINREPTGILQLSASGDARYEIYAELLAVVKRAGIERLNLAGNEGFVASLDR